ncbi:hypothetical protein E5720_07215 [Rhodococcus sp. PAMC28707]|uniref:hypothetical protein n=1 Tax=unclassified Rhodococcus (in: high G+C Gram-positive bacteria) TaxID=192944 RepID=UPI00109E082C|nr:MULTISPECIES: hypothetical protein [unclassified Rhodococcus (in: high G+C Gram-positive bacteria)]QCB49976.1 hypothetical protein E5769_06800 [Rhodococcus sp. PAMC28705]QCB58329.1 hypothetical protein E5720_07215 [Rhodococcus sp. PAMC28707]
MFNSTDIASDIAADSRAPSHGFIHTRRTSPGSERSQSAASFGYLVIIEVSGIRWTDPGVRFG